MEKKSFPSYKEKKEKKKKIKKRKKEKRNQSLQTISKLFTTQWFISLNDLYTLSMEQLYMQASILFFPLKELLTM